MLIVIRVNGNPVVADNDFLGKIPFSSGISVSAILVYRYSKHKVPLHVVELFSKMIYIELSTKDYPFRFHFFGTESSPIEETGNSFFLLKKPMAIHELLV